MPHATHARTEPMLMGMLIETGCLRQTLDDERRPAPTRMRRGRPGWLAALRRWAFGRNLGHTCG
jgi:hypothetical protein